MTTFGIIGAGNIGSQLARAAVGIGYDVVISNSRGPETLASLVAELGDRARAATPAEAAAAGDIVVVTIPLGKIDELPVDALAGKLIIDTNNYYPQRDGQIASLDDESTTTSELLQTLIPTARIVKAFNHIAAVHITEQAQPTGTPDRRALVIAGDDAEAKATVAAFIDAIGFDALDIGALSEGWRIQRDTPGYVVRLTAPELASAVASAKRYRDQ